MTSPGDPTVNSSGYDTQQPRARAAPANDGAVLARETRIRDIRHNRAALIVGLAPPVQAVFPVVVGQARERRARDGTATINPMS